MSENDVWQKYSAVTSESAARPRLLETLNTFFPSFAGMALDLGCGGGRDTRELLKRGWSVDALDANESALTLVSSLQTNDNRLNLIPQHFEDARFEKEYYDLINASASLPFCSLKELKVLWQKLLSSLKPGGIISCDFFGINDEWNDGTHGSMSFLSKADVEELLENLKTESLAEKEMIGPTALGASKHWHIFTCIARRI
ncbi:class I SAM-dependent methyltransferase [Bdellovibrio svalbardensis]|uniref:Class I SAM-dependent methyltransferase n=1 Tax=Bdellovibrio svalbardensis TaxID=2972972 RepID=A0ABT6DKV9_9BACT|nr:class I SAM-dependent methyltransferase [Bdellovibrio svalbardensis]MDG0817194.1 class I SAM-dependent methyltransferase [Bdellovibrio svalbardensis]